MQIQHKWDEMCDAHVKDDWGQLAKSAADLRQLLDEGSAPVVAKREDLGHAFQLALANAGVAFVLKRIFERHHA